MIKCCVCGAENSEPQMVLDEEMDIYYCQNCYLAENSADIDNR